MSRTRTVNFDEVRAALSEIVPAAYRPQAAAICRALAAALDPAALPAAAAASSPATSTPATSTPENEPAPAPPVPEIPSGLARLVDALRDELDRKGLTPVAPRARRAIPLVPIPTRPRFDVDG
jgi:hypothetical protein